MHISVDIVPERGKLDLMSDTPPVYQRGLFPQLPMPTEGDVHEALTPHYPLLWECIMGPWEDFLERRGSDRAFTDLTENESAQWLTIQAAHRARQLLTNRDAFRLLNPHGKLVIVVNDKYAFTIKKMTKRTLRVGGEERLTRSNYLTTRNKKLWNQIIDTALPDYPRLILGYELLKEVTDISILIAYPRTNKHGVRWAYCVPKQARTAPQIFVPPTEQTQEPEKGFHIMPPDAHEVANEDKETGSTNE